MAYCYGEEKVLRKMDKLNAFIEHLEADEDREAAANEAYQQELFKKYVLRGGNEPGERRRLWELYQEGAGLTGPKGLRRQLAALTWNIWSGLSVPLLCQSVTGFPQRTG